MEVTSVDSDQFSPVNSLASAYLDINNIPSAEALIEVLDAKARTPNDRSLAEHTKARIAFAKGDLAGSEKALKQEIGVGRNLVPNLAIAALALTSAEHALARIEERDPSNKFIETLRSKVAERRGR